VTSPLRIVLDVNVFVRLVKAKREQRSGTAAQRIFSALESGRMCGRPAQIVASHRMMDTLSDVLRRLSVPADLADEFSRAVIDVMKAGPEELDPHLILGGTPDLMLRDTEDGGVLATAFGARAHVLVTDNLIDFMPTGCESYETTRIRLPDGHERTLTCHILSRPDGLEIVVAHPIDFATWISEMFDPTPKNVRDRLSKPANTPAESPNKH
jgi:predicted nucleic acid-binding protein